MFGMFDSVDNVISKFQQMVDRLRTIQVQKVTEADVLEEDASILLADAREARKEANRAEKVAAKISKLLEE